MFGNIGRVHPDDLLKPGCGPVVAAAYLDPGVRGAYAPGSGFLYLSDQLRLDAYENGQIDGATFDATLEHELVHFTQYFWNDDSYVGEEGWDYVYYIYK